MYDYNMYSCYTVLYLNKREVVKIYDYMKVIALFDRVINKYIQWGNKQRTYGTDTVLTKAEIHTIAAVGDNPGINITALADILGITKGAASQMIYKLVRKSTVEKKVSPDSDTEVVLNLTEEGQKNYVAHSEFHRQTNDESIKLLKDMPESTYTYMIEFFLGIEKIMDEKLKEK